MKLKLKKIENKIYIVDAEVGFYNIPIAIPEQIDIDNLFDKYLEALAGSKYPISKGGLMWMPSTADITTANKKEGYLQAKKETCFELEDIVKASQFGANWTYDSKGVFDSKERERYVKDTMIFIQQLKISKIPECEVEIEMESVLERSEYGMPNSNLLHCFPQGIFVSKPKLTDNKVTITKIIL